MKDKKFLRGVLLGSAATMVIFLLAITILLSTNKLDLSGIFTGDGSYRSIRREVNQKLNTLGMYVDEYFLDDLDREKLTSSIYKGFFAGLGDKYAQYYTEEEYAAMVDSSQGVFCGIGIEYYDNEEAGTMDVLRVIEDGPAQKAGIRQGDKIVKVDGKSVSGKESAEVKASLKGKEGTKVNLTVLRDESTMEFSVKREKIVEKTVNSKMYAGKIGYVQVTEFDKVTVKQFTKAIDKLEEKGAKGIIIDLRNNGGGLLDVAVEMADRILSKGLVVYSEDKYGEKREYYAEDEKSVNIPVAILVNGSTASASEVFSGALEDYGKAVLVGEKTFGKGIVQGVFELSDGSAIKMTTEKYYTPKGRDIHKIGLTPSIEIELSEKKVMLSDKKTKVDNQFQAAWEYLQDN